MAGFEHASVPREVRGVQEQSRDRSCAMATGPHHGRDGGGGLPYSQRALSSADLLFRAECTGWQLESGVCNLPHGRTAHPGLSGPHGIPSGSRPSVLGIDSESVGSSSLRLYLKDLEVLQTKKNESVAKSKAKAAPSVEEESPSPRRRPRPLLAKGTNDGQR